MLQYLTTLTNTQNFPAKMATGNMLDDKGSIPSTGIMSRPAKGSNVQEVTKRSSTIPKPMAPFHQASEHHYQ
jgi:hypothetical protein